MTLLYSLIKGTTSWLFTHARMMVNANGHKSHSGKQCHCQIKIGWVKMTCESTVEEKPTSGPANVVKQVSRGTMMHPKKGKHYERTTPLIQCLKCLKNEIDFFKLSLLCCMTWILLTISQHSHTKHDCKTLSLTLDQERYVQRPNQCLRFNVVGVFFFFFTELFDLTLRSDVSICKLYLLAEMD